MTELCSAHGAEVVAYAVRATAGRTFELVILSGGLSSGLLHRLLHRLLHLLLNGLLIGLLIGLLHRLLRIRLLGSVRLHGLTRLRDGLSVSVDGGGVIGRAVLVDGVSLVMSERLAALGTIHKAVGIPSPEAEAVVVVPHDRPAIRTDLLI